MGSLLSVEATELRLESCASRVGGPSMRVLVFVGLMTLSVPQTDLNSNEFSIMGRSCFLVNEIAIISKFLII